MKNNQHQAIWPSENYLHQIKKLTALIGEDIFLIELRPSYSNMAIRHTDKKYKLLAVIDFPAPDPESGLYPQNILLDDGRGINLGRIARISTDTAFGPSKEQIVFEDNFYLNKLLSAQHRVSKKSIAATSKKLLGEILGGQASSRVTINPRHNHTFHSTKDLTDKKIIKHQKH